jgi:glycosyltransferase involved in cell wall biosynthesis
MKISVVIPTYNRRQELEDCLDSVYAQRYQPLEIIIVNNGPLDISDIIEQKRSQFSSQNIPILYVDNQRDNSITVAKNIGTMMSSGDIISFLDDDMTIDIHYYEEIVKVFSEFAEAKGVTGYNQECKSETRENEVLKGRWDFVTSYVDTDKMEIRPSLTVSNPDIHLNHVIECQWLSGASCFKKDILIAIKPDENLKKYSWNEDQDLSFRIFKKYSHSLFLTPFAKYWHKGSPAGRAPKRETILMGAVYDRYLFHKNFEQSLNNKRIFLRGQLFKLVYYLFFTNPRGWASFSKITELLFRLEAIVYCLFHKKEIARGDLAFFNKTLK